LIILELHTVLPNNSGRQAAAVRIAIVQGRTWNDKETIVTPMLYFAPRLYMTQQTFALDDASRSAGSRGG
jgi:hypothetical protein